MSGKITISLNRINIYYVSSGGVRVPLLWILMWRQLPFILFILHFEWMTKEFHGIFCLFVCLISCLLVYKSVNLIERNIQCASIWYRAELHIHIFTLKIAKPIFKLCVNWRRNIRQFCTANMNSVRMADCIRSSNCCKIDLLSNCYRKWPI